MIVKVKMLAFCEPEQIREVEIDNEGDDVLETVFFYGQNDHQPKQMPSVSVGDVICWNEKYFLILPVGFQKV